MRSVAIPVLFCLLAACSGHSTRGIADRRTDFRQFLPMKGDPSHYGLKAVRPLFRSANRSQIIRAIETACRDSRKRGSSVFNEQSQSGYYVNCNPENRQLLNGFVSANPSEAPHS